MSISEPTPATKTRLRLSMPGEIALLAAIACGFLLLHVLAGTLLLPSGSGPVTPQEQASLSSAD
ncbi:MAG: hypothetical protein JO141_33990 [Bradyrhizobium sp.]|nr:hypothetical protein [Bradyrhizobium sp.]